MSARTAGFHAVLFASVAATAIAFSPHMSAASAESARPASFTPPDRPMVLSRTLHRPLPGGAEVVTIRTYEIRFSRTRDGYRIDGKLLSADITVPPRFEALAQIERNRPDSGLFPMMLDHRGRLLPAPPRDAAESAQAAGDLAASKIPDHLPAGEARDAQAFIGRISANPVHTAWPEDLFSPEPGKHGTVQTIPLPDGKTGQVSVVIEASTDTRTGLLSRLTRRVATDLDGSRRVTIETWTLAAGPWPGIRNGIILPPCKAPVLLDLHGIFDDWAASHTVRVAAGIEFLRASPIPSERSCHEGAHKGHPVDQTGRSGKEVASDRCRRSGCRPSRGRHRRSPARQAQAELHPACRLW